MPNNINQIQSLLMFLKVSNEQGQSQITHGVEHSNIETLIIAFKRNLFKDISYLLEVILVAQRPVYL